MEQNVRLAIRHMARQKEQAVVKRAVHDPVLRERYFSGAASDKELLRRLDKVLDAEQGKKA